MEGISVKSNEQSKRFQSLGLSNKGRIWTNTGGHRKDRICSEQNCWISNGNYIIYFIIPILFRNIKNRSILIHSINQY